MTMEIYVANISRFIAGAANDGKWVSLPASGHTLSQILDAIGVDDGTEYFIPTMESDLEGLTDVIGEHTSLAEVNALARLLVLLPDCDLKKLEAILEMESPDLFSLMAILETLDNYDFYPDIHDDEDLGRYFVDELGCLSIPDHLKNYIDYESYGRDIRLESSGGFAAGGFLFTQ